MTAELAFLPAARAEAVAAAIYLEAERVGYGEMFELELVEVCDRVVRHPKSGSPLEGYPAELDVRAFAMSRFRYSLIVATIAGEPMVCALAHHHRQPGYWRDRLR